MIHIKLVLKNLLIRLILVNTSIFFRNNKQIPITLTLVLSSFFIANSIYAQALESANNSKVSGSNELDNATNSAKIIDAKYQITYVRMHKPGFFQTYSGRNSLSPNPENSYTLTSTAYLGTKLWTNSEIYFNPELTMSNPLSGLHGLGGLTNGENQKGVNATPKVYNARLFIRHSFGIGGGEKSVPSAANQIAGLVDKNRVVLTVGKVSLMDLFDGNKYSHDPRTQFLNWSLMANGAYDYAADMRGYASGVAVEYYKDDYVLRIGRFTQPKESNGLPLDYRLLKHYGDQIEVEKSHMIFDQPGKIRFLTFRNKANMGLFQDAINMKLSSIPNLEDVRKENTKIGLGINIEQAINNAVGTFFRFSKNDGKTETYAFTEIERSVSGGVHIRGVDWGRSADVLGIGYSKNGLSKIHQQYLGQGGLGAFIGDGVPLAGTSFLYKNENVFESFYNFQLNASSTIGLNLQHIANPAYNSSRGPVNFYGIRLHSEF